MFNLVVNDVDTSKITVIPARCGLGKSTVVQALISYFVSFDTYDYRCQDSVGAVVITDQLERLKGFQDSPKHLNSLWGSAANNEKHEKYCSYISSAETETPVMKQLIASRYKPIVLLSTQRYFSMSDEQRELLFTFEVGRESNKKELKREIVIFDEKPYFYSLQKITIKKLNDVDTALRQGIPRELAEKDWILEEYGKFRDKTVNILRQKEKIQDNDDKFYWQDHNTDNLTSNDDRFFELIEQNKNYIASKDYPNALTDLKDFKKLMVDGGFFITRKLPSCEEYETYFQLYQENRGYFYLGQDKAKFFVLDATSDIDLDYQCDYVNMVDCTSYNIPLDMSIYHVNVNTSRSSLVYNNNSSPLISAICETLKQQNRDGLGGLLVATYQNIEDSFKSNGVQVGHFGGLKGSNTYMEIPKMAQVGLNRYSDFAYFTTYMYLNPDILENLKSMDEYQSRAYIRDITKIESGIFANPDMNQIMINSILADFEQNIFRTAIRQYNNDKPVKIWAYWNCNTYAGLNELIAERYSKHGVEIEFLGVPLAVQKMKTVHRKPAKGNKKTNPQKIIEWFGKQSQGREFKVAEMLREIGIDNNILKRIRKTNSTVRNLFQQSSTEKQGYYKIS